jgi:Calpain family cysteine protease
MARKHDGAARAVRLGLTPLEDRTLPASGVAASLTNGVLSVADYKAADTLVIRQTPTGVSLDSADTHQAFSAVTRVVVDVVYDDHVTNDVSGLSGTPARPVYLSRRDLTGATFVSSGSLAPGTTADPPSSTTIPPPPSTPPPGTTTSNSPNVSAGLSGGILRLAASKAAGTVVIGQTPTGVTVTATSTNLSFTAVTRVTLDVQYDVVVTNDVSGLGSAAAREVYLNRRDQTGVKFISSGDLAPGSTSGPSGTTTPPPTTNPPPTTTPPPPTTGDWFDRAVNDANLRSLVRTVAADGAIDRIDMLRLFDKVASDGSVSANELHDLKAIEKPDWTAGGALPNQARFSMPDPVRGLTGEVVDGDRANATYQGTPLGNLQAGSSGAQLQKLVLKWFLGTDRPVAGGGTTYKQASGTLFVNGPSVGDVRQGNLSDCYFLAGLAELAQDRPAAIQQMFTDNGDGTVTVRFFNNGIAKYVTVDRMLPTDASGRLVYAGFGATASNPANELWVVLAEKAYAQLNQQGWTEQDGTNSFAGIEDGYSDTVMAQVTGGTASYTTIIRASAADLQAAVASGKPTVLNSRSTSVNGVVANHTYPVVGYDATTQKFNLYNPQGSYIQLTWTQITQSFAGYFQLQ